MLAFIWSNRHAWLLEDKTCELSSTDPWRKWNSRKHFSIIHNRLPCIKFAFEANLINSRKKSDIGKILIKQRKKKKLRWKSLLGRFRLHFPYDLICTLGMVEGVTTWRRAALCLLRTRRTRNWSGKSLTTHNERRKKMLYRFDHYFITAFYCLFRKKKPTTLIIGTTKWKYLRSQALVGTYFGWGKRVSRLLSNRSLGSRTSEKFPILLLVPSDWLQFMQISARHRKKFAFIRRLHDLDSRLYNKRFTSKSAASNPARFPQTQPIIFRSTDFISSVEFHFKQKAKK